jgi:diguanylate cyclase (GGDEF)-like protein
MMSTSPGAEEVLDLMVEAELCLKYNCYSQAQQYLADIIDRYPRYLPAKQALESIFRKTGEIDRALDIAREIDLISTQLAEEGSQKNEIGGSNATLQKRQLIEKVDAIIRQIYDSKDLDGILKISASSLTESLSADRCVIIGQGQEKQQSIGYEYCKEGILASLDSKSAKLNFLLWKRVSGSVEPLVIDETIKDPALIECIPALEDLKIQSLMACPLVYKSEVIGLILVHRCKRPISWQEHEKTLLATVAGHIAVAISNAQQFSAIQAMAITDKLTGLYNRRFFEQRLSAELRNAQQQQYPVCLALLDIDHFKQVNDTYGRAAGDRILHKLSFLLKTNLRKGSVVARFGGEEFVLILPRVGLDTAQQIMDNLRELVKRTIMTDSGRPITISVGVAEATLMDRSEVDLIQSGLIEKADSNLYHAKRSGRNQVCAALHPTVEVGQS